MNAPASDDFFDLLDFAQKRGVSLGVEKKTVERWRSGVTSEIRESSIATIAGNLLKTLRKTTDKAWLEVVERLVQLHAPALDVVTDATFGQWLHDLAFPPVRELHLRNPFALRGAIWREPEAFIGRRDELDRLYDIVTRRENAQIVGPRRIGKSSLARAVERLATGWLRKPAVAWADVTNAANQTMSGFYETLSLAWKWDAAPTTNADFSRSLQRFLDTGAEPVLLVDEFEKFIDLAAQFDLAFFENLRAQADLSIITVSRVTLDQIRKAGANISAYYNTFAVIPVGEFCEEDAAVFVEKKRPGVEPFTPTERAAIRAFAGTHPLKLSIACDLTLRAKRGKRSLESALIGAGAEWEVLRPREKGEK